MSGEPGGTGGQQLMGGIHFQADGGGNLGGVDPIGFQGIAHQHPLKDPMPGTETACQGNQDGQRQQQHDEPAQIHLAEKGNEGHGDGLGAAKDPWGPDHNRPGEVMPNRIGLLWAPQTSIPNRDGGHFEP